MAKRKKSIVGWLVAAVAVLGVGVLGFATGGFLDWDKESMKDRFVPKTELAVKKVEIGDRVQAKKTTITADENNVYVLGGEIPFDYELYQEEGIKNAVELKVTLKYADETAVLKATRGDETTLLNIDDKWLGKQNILRESVFTYLLKIDEDINNYVLLIDNDGDFETINDQVVLNFELGENVIFSNKMVIFDEDLSALTINNYVVSETENEGEKKYTYKTSVKGLEISFISSKPQEEIDFSDYGNDFRIYYVNQEILGGEILGQASLKLPKGFDDTKVSTLPGAYLEGDILITPISYGANEDYVFDLNYSKFKDYLSGSLVQNLKITIVFN